MSTTNNDLAFTIHPNIIEHFSLRAATYQRLLLDKQIGISTIVNASTVKQDEALHQFVQNINIDNTYLKGIQKIIEDNKNKGPSTSSDIKRAPSTEEIQKKLDELKADLDDLSILVSRGDVPEQPDDNNRSLLQQLEPAGAQLPPSVRRIPQTSFILNYGLKDLSYIKQHKLTTTDYNITAIAQPYKAIAYYTKKQIAIPNSEWYWRGQTDALRINLCRLQRTWSVSNAPNDKLALMRHAMMTYYILADLSPLLEPFIIENALEQKPMGDLFNDLDIQKQLNLETAEQSMQMEASGASLQNDLDQIQEGSTFMVGGTSYTVVEWYKQEEHSYGFIVIDATNKEFYLYATEDFTSDSTKMNTDNKFLTYLSERPKNTFQWLEKLLTSISLFDAGKEVNIQNLSHPTQTFDNYVDTIDAANTLFKTKRDIRSGKLNTVNNANELLEEIQQDKNPKLTYRVNMSAQTIVQLCKLLEFKIDPNARAYFLRAINTVNQTKVLVKYFKPTAKNNPDNSVTYYTELIDNITGQIQILVKGATSKTDLLPLLYLKENIASPKLNTDVDDAISSFLRTPTNFSYLKYVRKEDRTEFWETYSKTIFGFALSAEQIALINTNERYDMYFEDLNENVINNNPISEYLKLVRNYDTNKRLLVSKQAVTSCLVHYHYNEYAFMVASFQDNTIEQIEFIPRKNGMVVGNTQSKSFTRQKKNTNKTRSQKTEKETKDAILSEYGPIAGNKIIEWLQGELNNINLSPSKPNYNPNWSNEKKEAINSPDRYNVGSSAPDGDCAYHSIFNATSDQRLQIFARYTMEGGDNQQTLLNKDNHVKRMRNDILHAIMNNNLPRNFETKNDTYLRVVSNDWAEEPEIAILAWLYGLNIKIWVDHDANTIKEIGNYSEYGSTINLYYRNAGGVVGGTQNHYDWLQKVQVTARRMMPMPMQASGANFNREKIEEILKENGQLEDLIRLSRNEDIAKEIMDQVNDLNVEDRNLGKYVQQVVDNMLYIKGYSGLVPYLCKDHSERAVLKYIDAMKTYLAFGHQMSRQGEEQNFYAENYKDFFQQQSWKTGVRRYAEYRKYKYPINDRSLQVDERVRDSVLENVEAVDAEHDLITLESSSSFANWSSIVRFALYEKYNYFLPDLHQKLQGGMIRKVKNPEAYDDKGIFEELMDREAFDDFVYVYCTMYTLIFNT